MNHTAVGRHRARSVWRSFNSRHTVFTFLECSYVPFICCTERVCAANSVEVTQQGTLDCQYPFITCTAIVQTCLATCGLPVWLWLTCSSQNSIHLVGRLSSLSCFKRISVNVVFLWPCTVTKCFRTRPFRHIYYIFILLWEFKQGLSIVCCKFILHLYAKDKWLNNDLDALLKYFLPCATLFQRVVLKW